MIPFYEKYKERGFTIVGVAREEKRENMASALANDGYPWLNLLELNDENKIWSKYGVNYSGGITILVDRDGTILAIRPTAEEVEKILKPENFTGRAANQVEELIRDYVDPILESSEVTTETAELTV